MQQSRKNALMMRAACPLIIGAALYAGHAQADTKIYGLMDVYTGSQKLPGAKNSNNVVNNGGMSTSYLGFSSSETIDGGITAGFVLEGFYRLDVGEWGRYNGDAMFARNSYLSLGNQYGEIRLGRNTTPYFVSTVAFNAFGDSYTFSPTVMHTYMPDYRSGKAGISGITNDSGWNNSIRYVTPGNLGGFNASLIYSLGENGNSKKDKWGGNIGYSSGPFAATAAFQQVKLDGDNAFKGVLGYNRQNAATVGLSYDFDVVKVFGQYQYIKNDIDSGDTTSQGGYGGVAVPVGKGKILAAYGYNHIKIDNSTGSASNNSVNRNSWSVGYDYNLSKRTDIYAAYYSDDVNELADGYTAGVGIRTRF